jgi:hypothetical protein
MELFSMTGLFLTKGNRPPYDVHPADGTFVMVSPIMSEASSRPQINVVLNRFEEVKARVPGP